jgi:hypothetical protein
MIITKFKMYKWNLTTTTTSLLAVKKLKLMGWKIAHSELSNLI